MDNIILPRFRLAGDCGLLAELGTDIDSDVNARVRALADAVKKKKLSGVVEIIPAYTSLLFTYDPAIIHPETLIQSIEKTLADIGECFNQAAKTVEIPVCYGGGLGPDINNICQSANLDVETVIKLHSEPEYLIYMVGFTPGFPFLGGLNEKLHMPRLKTPRTRVPEGSVGIANNQTGIYPVASPGGWQIIGRTPLTLFAPESDPPFLYKAGDRLKFIPVSRSEYHSLKQAENKR